jgi:hypothetical protein
LKMKRQKYQESGTTCNCQLSIINCQFRKWSAFPSQTQYHYAYNSPLTYRDPTGLAPEKEKEGEELQGLEINWEYIYAI